MPIQHWGFASFFGLAWMEWAMSAFSFVQAFREAAPYIHYLRGKTLVIGLSSDVLDTHYLNELASDFHLMAALGVRLVLVHGCQTQIEKMAKNQNYPIYFHQNRCIADEQVMQFAKQACGGIQFDFQAALSLGVARAPQRPPRVRVVQGNFLTAQPLGVIHGVDMRYTGQIRKVDFQAISDALDRQAIVLMNPIGTSLSGQNYVISMNEVAQAVAVALKAEKLIFLTKQLGILDKNQNLIRNLTASEASILLADEAISHEQKPLLNTAIMALEQGVSRVQILSGHQNGDLLRELFTRDGAGTSIAQSPFMRVRAADEKDVADIMNLIKPLEEKGILLKRSREYMENHIQEFWVLEHDRQIYGCVALKNFSENQEVAELACLVVSPDARQGGYGELLLKQVIEQAKKNGKKRLFALSTHTVDWFTERHFQAANVDELPENRQKEYFENGRQSKILVLELTESIQKMS